MHERCMHELMHLCTMHLCTIHLCTMEEEDKEMEGGLDMYNGLDNGHGGTVIWLQRPKRMEDEV